MYFIKSYKNGHLYQMNGNRKKFINKNILSNSEKDVLAEDKLNIIREFIRKEKSGNFNFSLLALVCCQTDLFSILYI
jgi:ubiquitin carboxyl-terminal hydrolase L3